MIASSLAKAKAIRCSTLNTEIHGTLIFEEINLTFDSRKVKKNSVTEKSESEKASVGHTPKQAAASTPVELLKLGKLSIIWILSGQASTHFVHSENLLIALTQEATLKCNFIYASTLSEAQFSVNFSLTYSKSLNKNSKVSSAPS